MGQEGRRVHRRRPERGSLITLLVSYYAEDPGPAIASAKAWMPIDRVIALDGRYEGFPDLTGGDEPVFESEHAKRNTMLAHAGAPQPGRWLFWLDCDERVVYASRCLHLQLERLGDPVRLASRPRSDVAGVQFIESTSPNAPGLADPRRGIRDHVIDAFPRLIRHVPGLEYRHRHDYLVDGAGNLLVGWANEYAAEPSPVDVIVVHLPDIQTAERVEAKRRFYQGPQRTAESRPVDALTNAMSRERGGWL